VPAAVRLPLPVHWIQFHPPIISDSEDLPVLGVHGPNRTTHQLPKPHPIRQPHPLPVGDISLERVPLPHNLQEQRVW